MLPSLLVISDSTRTDNIEDTLKQCIDMGANFIGIREYDMTLSSLSALTQSLMRYSENSETLISVWNNPELAQDLSIGLHMSSTAYNDTLKSTIEHDKPLGKSCHNSTEIMSAGHADYITISPVYDSISKQGYKGMGLKNLVDLLPYAPTPVFALGGVIEGNIRDLIGTGIYGVAVCGTVMDNPKSIKNLLKHL